MLDIDYYQLGFEMATRIATIRRMMAMYNFDKADLGKNVVETLV